jgi:hypothetical protein
MRQSELAQASTPDVLNGEIAPAQALVYADVKPL